MGTLYYDQGIKIRKVCIFFFGKQENIINYKTLVEAPVLQSLERQRPIKSSNRGCKTTGGGNKNSSQLSRGRTHLS